MASRSDTPRGDGSRRINSRTAASNSQRAGSGARRNDSAARYNDSAGRRSASDARRSKRPSSSRRSGSSPSRASQVPSALSQAVDSNRASLIVVLFGLLALIFFVRLVYLQVIVADKYSAMAEESRTVSFTTTARRGTIYDRNGTVLATSVDATTIYANPAEVEDAAVEAEQLASVLGGEAADYEAKLSQEDATFVYVKRQADVDLAAEVEELGLAGVYFIEDTRREYPCGQIGGQIVGYCNVDGEGITGLELQYDDILSGTNGTYSAERGENGIPIPGGVKEDEPAVDGQDIMISIDVELQEYVEERLSEAADTLSAEGGTVVVMDGGTGEIYAAASLPYLDPSDMTTVEETADQLKAVTQAYEPGSVFKSVSALALLETGTMGSEDTIYCPSVITADGYEVSDSHDRSDTIYTLRQILEQSSNVGISLAVKNMGFDELYNHILAYNLNELTGVDYPGEASGTLQDIENWATITGYNVSFGQGIATTPLQITRFYGALVNDGVETTPHFLIENVTTGETPEYATEDVVENKEAIPTLVDMLETVVESGTGTPAQIDGFSVAGKTSTAEVADSGSYKSGVYNLCFTGFLPDSTSQLVCFVGANEVPSTGNVADAFKDIMTFAIDRFNIMPE